MRDLCIKNGLMIRAVRDTLVMSPPLIISHDEIDQLVGIIRTAPWTPRSRRSGRGWPQA